MCIRDRHEPGEEADAFNNARKEHSSHHQHLQATLPKSSTSASSTPKLANATLKSEETNSKPAPPVLTPAPVPPGSNPWGISQTPTPVSAIFSKNSASTTFPTLSTSLVDGFQSAGPATPITSVSAPTTNNNSSGSGSKKKGEKTYEDPYDPLTTCVKFLDKTFDLSLIHI